MNMLLEIADSLQLKGLGRLKDNTAMSKFLSSSEESGLKNSSSTDKKNTGFGNSLSNDKEEEDRTSCSGGGGILFEDTPDASEEEAISDTDKQMSSNADTPLHFSASNHTNVQERFFPCSTTIGPVGGINNPQQINIENSTNSIHCTTYHHQSPATAICFSQSSYSARPPTTLIQQQHFNQTAGPSHLYNPCTSKREYEGRMSVAARGAMIDYANQNLNHQLSSLTDFRLQNKMVPKSNEQQDLLYQQSAQVDTNHQQQLATALLQSGNANQQCSNLQQLQTGAGSTGPQIVRHYTHQYHTGKQISWC